MTFKSEDRLKPLHTDVDGEDLICPCGRVKEDEEGTHCYECGVPMYGVNWFVGD